MQDNKKGKYVEESVFLESVIAEGDRISSVRSRTTMLMIWSLINSGALLVILVMCLLK